ncbi:MAG TPA: Ig-like domain-containing protein [Nocardioidaceae bacterium]|nr:Ig-like domain-containing protein [Nocardioidaceae bacterium]
MMAGKPIDSAKGRGLSRRATAALLCSLLAGTGVVTTAAPASADVTEVTPPHDIGVFPMRDFLGIGGWGVGKEMSVKVIRDGVQIGSAGPMTLAADLELDGFAEVNHPGGVCWNGVTPNIVAGDRIEAVDADGNGEFTVVQNVEVTKPATKVDADGDGAEDDIVAQGIAANLDGTGRMNPSLVEQRVINPDLKDTTVGRRDVRAIFGDGLADGVETLGEITWDSPANAADPHWTATYLNLGEDIATLVEAGQSRMLAWERTDAADNRIGMTLWEYGELGGPGMGGCPATADYSVGGANPRHVNTVTRTQGNVTLTGTAHNVDTVKVSVDDHDPATAAVTADATVAKPVNMTDTTVAMPGATTWTASVPMAGLLALDDDTLVASATYGAVKESTTTTPDDPATPDVDESATVTTRTSSPIGGATLNILKDLTVPAAPTAFPGAGRFTSAQSVSISPDNEIEDTVRYRVGATPAATADPTAASPIVPNQLPVTTTQTVKARSYDPAGNPSAVTTLEYTIAPLAVPGAPTVGTAVRGNASATVSWTAPADDGGSPITSYIVETWAGASFVKDTTVPASATSAVIGQLTNGTSYSFKVAAVNAQGEGRPSAASNVVTPTAPLTVPGAPTIGAPTAANASATVRWTAPASNGGSAITGYSVRVFNGATQVGTPRVVGNVTSTVVTGLTNGTAYTFDVAAINSVGTGTVSGRSAAATPRTEFVAPTVTGRSPAVGATAVAQTTNVTATFSEPVTGVSPTTFTVRNAAGATVPGSTVTYDATTRVATFNPGGATASNLAADSTYTVALTNGVRDAAGNPLAPTTWTFVTGPRPVVSARTPASGATGVARNANVSATFSEGVTGWTAANVTMSRLDASGAVVGTVTGTFAYNATTRVGAFNPFGTATTTLAASTRYRMNLGAGLRDAAGNPLAATSWIFTTGTA